LLIDAYATLEPIDVAAAENILKLIASDRQRPTSAHYAALVHAHGCVKQDLETAKSWFYRVTNPQFADYVPPDETLYQALIEAYVANHQVADCSSLFQHMKENNVKLTVYMANHLIHGWTIAGNLDEAKKVFDSLAAEKNGLYGREPSSYEQMTRTYLAMGDRESALALVDEMKTKGYPAAVVARVTDILEGGDGFGGPYLNGSHFNEGVLGPSL
jgi:pentatricopeptide repeat protein